MKFILIESVPTINPSLVKQWNNSNDEQKREIIDSFIEFDYKNPQLKNVEEAMFNIFKSFGIDNNPFIEFFDKARNISKKEYNDKIIALKDLYLQGFVDVDKDYLYNPTLYAGRKNEDFDYTVKILDSVTHPNKLKKYFTDTTNINIKDLFDGNSIKPAGGPNTKDDFDTIYGVIEHWTNQDRETYGEPEGEYSLSDWFRKIKVNYSQRPKATEILINKYYAQSIKKNHLVGNTKKDQYIQTAELLLNSESGLKRIPDYDLGRFPKERQFNNPEDIPSKFKESGKVVWVRNIGSHSSSGPTEESNRSGFLVFDGNKWITREDYNSKIAEKNSGIQKLADKFTNDKYIDDISNNINVCTDVCLWLQGNASKEDIDKYSEGDMDDFSYRI